MTEKEGKKILSKLLLENNKNIPDINQILNYIDEKTFYKTSSKMYKPKKLENANLKKRVYSSIPQKIPKIEHQKEKEIIQVLQKRINEIESELEKNENTFSYNQKLLRKKLEEKDLIISKLTQKLENINDTNKKDFEINNIKNQYLSEIKELKLENDKLKMKNEEFIKINEDNDNKIKELQEKIKKLSEEKKEIYEKYNIFIINDDKKIFEDDIKDLIKRYGDKLIEDQNEINALNNNLNYIISENKRLKILTKEIIEARNETEIFFLDALNEVKRDLYKIKKEKDKRGTFFPTLKKNYENNMIKVDIRTLTPELREKILRNLFAKINKGHDENRFNELNNIMNSNVNDEDLF